MSLRVLQHAMSPKLLLFNYSANLAFWDYFHSLWNNTFSRNLTITEPVFPIFLEDFSQDPASQFYTANTTASPSILQELITLTTQKRSFLRNRKKLFSTQQGGVTPQLPRLQSKSKSSFLFTVITHIYVFIGSTVGICMLVPQIYICYKAKKDNRTNRSNIHVEA